LKNASITYKQTEGISSLISVK